MADNPVDDEPVDDDEDGAGNDPADDDRPARAPRPGRAAGGSFGGDGAGWILGLLLWSGVVLPFLNGGGAAGVKAWWMAKFLNKAPDGSWLP
jgi:hypothetical protein